MSATPRVVRKRLGDDCLLHGDLHPNVADRLDRVRELPLKNVANLLSVERGDDGGVWMVWQYVEGMTLEEFLSSGPSLERTDRVARDLKRVVAALHAGGLVHGALHERNIIIDPQGQVILTHISPLLYSDPARDEQALLTPLARLGHPIGQAEAVDGIDGSSDRAMRIRAYLLASSAVLGAVVMFLAILWYIRT